MRMTPSSMAARTSHPYQVSSRKWVTHLAGLWNFINSILGGAKSWRKFNRIKTTNVFEFGSNSSRWLQFSTGSFLLFNNTRIAPCGMRAKWPSKRRTPVYSAQKFLQLLFVDNNFFSHHQVLHRYQINPLESTNHNRIYLILGLFPKIEVINVVFYNLYSYQ